MRRNIPCPQNTKAAIIQELPSNLDGSDLILVSITASVKFFSEGTGIDVGQVTHNVRLCSSV